MKAGEALSSFGVNGMSPNQTATVAPLVATVLGTDTSGSGGQVQQAAASGSQGGFSPVDLQKSVDKLNQMLAGSQTKVEVDAKSPANQLWLNVVDQSTGKVIQRFPPEGLRNFMETSSTKGLALDLKL